MCGSKINVQICFAFFNFFHPAPDVQESGKHKIKLVWSWGPIGCILLRDEDSPKTICLQYTVCTVFYHSLTNFYQDGPRVTCFRCHTAIPMHDFRRHEEEVHGKTRKVC